MPATAEIDTSAEEMQLFESGREYEPSVDTASASVDMPRAEAIEDRGTGRGGEDTERVEYTNNHTHTFTGEEVIGVDGRSFTQMIEASGDVESIMMHREMKRQWKEAQDLNIPGTHEFWNRENRVKDTDGETVYKSRMWLNEDGSVGSEIRSIRISANDNQPQALPERDWEIAIDAVSEIPTFDNDPRGTTPEENFFIMTQEAAAVTETPALIELDASPATIESAPDIQTVEEDVPLVAAEIAPPQESTYAFPDIEIGPVLQAEDLNEFLAMDQLPALDLDSEEVIILKAPEEIEDDTQNEIDQDTPVFAEQVVPQMSQAAHVEPVIPVPPVVEAQDEHTPIVAFENEIKSSVPVTPEKQTIIAQEAKAPAAQPKEEFKGRRGARTRPEPLPPYVARHGSDEEAVRMESRSREEHKVPQMSERFAPEATLEPAEESVEAYREPLPEAVAALASERVAPQEIREQIPDMVRRFEAAPLVRAIDRDIPAQAESVLATESEDERALLVPSLELPTAEQNMQSEVEKVLQQFHFTRPTANPEIMRAANENLQSVLGRRPAIVDVPDEQRRDRIVTKRGPITMVKIAAQNKRV